MASLTISSTNSYDENTVPMAPHDDLFDRIREARQKLIVYTVARLKPLRSMTISIINMTDDRMLALFSIEIPESGKFRRESIDQCVALLNNEFIMPLEHGTFRGDEVKPDLDCIFYDSDHVEMNELASTVFSIHSKRFDKPALIFTIPPLFNDQKLPYVLVSKDQERLSIAALKETLGINSLL
jgi:hypothetical protein